MRENELKNKELTSNDAPVKELDLSARKYAYEQNCNPVRVRYTVLKNRVSLVEKLENTLY